MNKYSIFLYDSSFQPPLETIRKKKNCLTKCFSVVGFARWNVRLTVHQYLVSVKHIFVTQSWYWTETASAKEAAVDARWRQVCARCHTLLVFLGENSDCKNNFHFGIYIPLFEPLFTHPLFGYKCLRCVLLTIIIYIRRRHLTSPCLEPPTLAVGNLLSRAGSWD